MRSSQVPQSRPECFIVSPCFERHLFNMQHLLNYYSSVVIFFSFSWIYFHTRQNPLLQNLLEFETFNSSTLKTSMLFFFCFFSLFIASITFPLSLGMTTDSVLPRGKHRRCRNGGQVSAIYSSYGGKYLSSYT